MESKNRKVPFNPTNKNFQLLYVKIYWGCTRTLGYQGARSDSFSEKIYGSTKWMIPWFCSIFGDSGFQEHSDSSPLNT